MKKTLVLLSIMALVGCEPVPVQQPPAQPAPSPSPRPTPPAYVGPSIQDYQQDFESAINKVYVVESGTVTQVVTTTDTNFITGTVTNIVSTNHNTSITIQDKNGNNSNYLVPASIKHGMDEAISAKMVVIKYKKVHVTTELDAGDDAARWHDYNHFISDYTNDTCSDGNYDSGFYKGNSYSQDFNYSWFYFDCNVIQSIKMMS